MLEIEYYKVFYIPFPDLNRYICNIIYLNNSFDYEFESYSFAVKFEEIETYYFLF